MGRCVVNKNKTKMNVSAVKPQEKGNHGCIYSNLINNTVISKQHEAHAFYCVSLQYR